MPNPIPNIQQRLLAFYDTHRRALPWREDPEPYAVWVSEVMLQQTRVEAVIPYFERWLERFPTVAALAEADRDEVLKAWEGLGYYSRARHLHAAARLVRERGEMPRQPEALRELPGIGEYTAGAIASIAFGLPVPAVDGNVRRVLSRLYDLRDPGPARLRRLAGGLVSRERPGDFNQALMELGATVCTPRSPDCGRCPVSEECLSRARGVQESRPRPRRRRAVPEHDLGCAVVTDGGSRLLLARRPEPGLLGGLWSFPVAEVEEGQPLRAAARAAEAHGIEPGEPCTARPLGVVDHAFTHKRVRYHAFLFRPGPDSGLAPVSGEWRDRAGVESLALPVAQRKIADLAWAELGGFQ